MIESADHNPETLAKEQLNLPTIAAVGTYEHY